MQLKQFMEYEQLKLENQLCFPFYAVSRLIIRAYQEDLDALGITYPQYLVMMVLWENDNITVNEIAEKLILNNRTQTYFYKIHLSPFFYSNSRNSFQQEILSI